MTNLPEWAVAQIVQRAGRGLADGDIEQIVRAATDGVPQAFLPPRHVGIVDSFENWEPASSGAGTGKEG